MSLRAGPFRTQFTVTDLYFTDDAAGEVYEVTIEESLPPVRRTVTAKVRQVRPDRRSEWINCSLPEWPNLHPIDLEQIALMAIEVYRIRVWTPSEVEHPDRFARILEDGTGTQLPEMERYLRDAS